MSHLHIEDLNAFGHIRMSLCGKELPASSLFRSVFVRSFDTKFQCPHCIAAESKAYHDAKKQNQSAVGVAL